MNVWIALAARTHNRAAALVWHGFAELTGATTLSPDH